MIPGDEDDLEQLLGRTVHRLDALAASPRAAPETRAAALAAAADLAGRLGAADVAAQRREEARDLAEAAALALPPGERDGFWERPGLAGLRDDPRSPGVTAPAALGLTPRVQRLLDILKRLAGEQRLDRLLARITDAAVELAGAERGFVLLAGDDGGLAPAAESGGADGPHEFSRTIAEAVLIDGETVVTVDARRDPRFEEFRSVHQLHLRSVAAIPIRGVHAPVGVLYLEHRGVGGRFSAEDLGLLEAFGDQAAIAVESARLQAAEEARRRELARAYADLEAAQAETERVLHARTEALASVEDELARTRRGLDDEVERHGMVGRSAGMRRVFALVDRMADVSVPVVIEGESGTGKELVARGIHEASARRSAPFVPLNCGAIPEPLLESELFGHVKGAFTGADRERRGAFVRASGGTLFLDEAAEMPPKMQVDLLRVLAEGRVRPVGSEQDVPVDVRVLVASPEPLGELVSQGRFREDLYYRLDVVRIRLPPLRDRGEDLPLLCDHVLRRIAAREGGRVRRLAPDAMSRLRAHPFPGNVRELEHLLLGAWVMAEGPVIEAHHLGLDGAALVDPAPPPAAFAEGPTEAPSGRGPPEATSEEEFKARERERILAALGDHGWNRARAARSLGIPRRTFYRRLAEYGIQ